jgi:hypothetical protein
MYLIYNVVKDFFPTDLMKNIFAVLSMIVYVAWVYMLLRQYFDVMVATDNYLYIVLWDSFFRYSIKVITRHSIQDMSVIPSWWLSVFLKDSHIIIATEQNDLIEFHHVYQASEVVRVLYSVRDANVTDEPQQYEPEQHELSTDDDKFKILVETLWEVIVDYMKKKE